MKLASMITDTLYKKYLNSQLAGVYLVKYSSEETMLDFKEALINKITKTPDHPDVLLVERDEKEKDYKVESSAIANFISFINYRPYELKTKIVFIRDAHLLSLIVSNKLLKTLEEMPSFVCVFLLVPQDETLLETVESRAIRIHLPNQSVVAPQAWSAESPQEILEIIKKSGNDHLFEKSIVEHLIDDSLKKANFQDVTVLLSDLELYKKSSNFNNPALARMTLLKK